MTISLRGLSAAAAAAWLLLGGLALKAAAPRASSLAPGRPFGRVLAPEAKDAYLVALSPGRWRFRLTPSGNTARLRLLAPDGNPLLTATTWRGLGWEDSFLVEVSSAGQHHLEIAAENGGAPVGAYQIFFEPALAATPADAALVAAEEARTAAIVWRAEGDVSAESIAAALTAAAEGLAPFGRRRPEIMTWLALAGFALDHQLDRAEPAATAALTLAEKLGDDPLRAQALEQRGQLRQQRGDVAAAREDFAAAAELWQRLGVPLGATRDRINVAALLLRAGSWEEARALFTAQEEVVARLGEKRLAATLAINLGGVFAYLGDSEAAIARLRAALALARGLGDRRLAAQAGNDLGVLLRRLGESGAAVAELQAALDAFRELGDKTWQARALNNLGFAYLSWGAAARARSAFDEALALRRAAGDRAGESATLKNLIRLALLDDDPDTAQALVEQVLALDRDLKNARGAAVGWRLAGQVRARRGDPGGAREAFARALEGSRQLGDRAGEAETLLARGELLLQADDPAARADLDAAESLAAALGDRALAVSAAVALGRLDRAAGELEAARRHLEAAIDGIETLRTAIADPGQRAAFLASRSRAYELLVAVLLEVGEKGEQPELAERALEVAERARARALLDWLEAPAADLDAGLSPQLRERFRAARRSLNARSQRQVELLAAGKEKEAAAALGEVHAALAELEAARAAMAAASPAWADLTATRTLTAAQIRALLEPGTTLLEFALGEERSVLFEVSSTQVAAHPLPPRAALEDLARQATRDLARLDLRTRATRRDATIALAAMLLDKVAPALPEKSRLVVIADGALGRLPFAALPLPDGRFLGDGRELVQPASASALAAQRERSAGRRPASGLLAIFADPVFEPNDPRLPAGATVAGPADYLQGYGRLPGSRAEAEAILAAAPKAATARGKILTAFGFDANRDRFENGDAAGYRVLHLATHGVLEAERPELAGILLSQFDPGGRPRSGLLSLQDLLGLRFGAELAVLSGCRTALGEELSGEGLVGLARGFLYAGVPRVMASLWPVEDEATRRLMESFYRAYFAGRPAAAALAAAQAELRADPRYADPYHWGAFVLIGDWR